MSKRPLYLSDISEFKANDNQRARIAPMDSPPTRRGRIRKVIFCATLAAIGFGGLFFVVPLYIDLVADRLEAQREAEENYNCAHYGVAMNRFYGRDVCEDEALHRELLKPTH